MDNQRSGEDKKNSKEHQASWSTCLEIILNQFFKKLQSKDEDVAKRRDRDE